MTSVFSGGMVYEYSQEPNNYGLVELNQKGDVFILKDFELLAKRYLNVKIAVGNPNEVERPGQCLDSYSNLNTRNAMPDSFATQMIIWC